MKRNVLAAANLSFLKQAPHYLPVMQASSYL
jgi:hypothetical protein